MIVEPWRHCNVFKQLFADHGDGFQQTHPRYNTPYDAALVEKMRGCGDPDKMGSIEYRCQPCGEGNHGVSMTCQASLCLRCAKVYVDDSVTQVSKMLHPGVVYRHLVLTRPDVLRTPFYQNAEVLLSELMRGGVKCLDEFLSRVSRKPLKGGYIVVVQPHGRNGQDNPHLHIMATRGGWNQEAEKWVHLDYWPYEMLRKKWQWHLLTMLRQTLKTKEINRLVDTCFTRYPNGFITNVQTGEVPARYERLARYLATYVVSPPISLRRINYYQGSHVGDQYPSHKTDRIERERVDVYPFIERMVQHVFPKGFKRIRYYGGQATTTFAKVKGLIQEALAKVKGLVKDAIKIIPA